MVVFMSSGTVDKLAHDFSHKRLCGIGCFLHLFVRNFYDFAFYAQVGDDGYAEYFDAAMIGNDDFGYGRHADSIGSQNMEQFIF